MVVCTWDYAQMRETYGQTEGGGRASAHVRAQMDTCTHDTTLVILICKITRNGDHGACTTMIGDVMPRVALLSLEGNNALIFEKSGSVPFPFSSIDLLAAAC